MPQPPLREGDVCYSFDWQTGKLLVIDIRPVCFWTGEPCALCLLLEDHPAGYKKGTKEAWMQKGLRVQYNINDKP